MALATLRTATLSSKEISTVALLIRAALASDAVRHSIVNMPLRTDADRRVAVIAAAICIIDENDRTRRGQEGFDLRYRMLMGLRRVLQNGAQVAADPMSPLSMPSRARRSPDRLINWVPLNDLYRAQDDLIETGQVVVVVVGGEVLLRPADGPFYDDEEPTSPPLRGKRP
jgi:hypothetical protein